MRSWKGKKKNEKERGLVTTLEITGVNEKSMKERYTGIMEGMTDKHFHLEQKGR